MKKLHKAEGNNMNKLIDLKRKQAEKVQALRGLLDKADEEKRNLTDEEKEQFDNLERELDEVAEQILREEKVQQRAATIPAAPTAERQDPQVPNPIVISGGIKEDIEPGIRLARYAKAVLSSRTAYEAPEAVAKRMYPKDAVLHESFRAMSTQSPSEGGVLVPENVSSEIIPLLREKGAVRSLGARAIPLPNGNLTIPRQTAGANFSWVGENEKVTSSQPALGSLKLSAKKLAGMIPLSNEMVRDSSVSADRWVRDEIVNGIVEKEDYTALYGTGTQYTPTGVFNASGVKKASLGAIPTSDDLGAVVGLLMTEKFGTLVSPGWLFNGALWSLLYNLKDGSGNYIHRQEMDQGKLLSFPFKINNNVTYNSGAQHADTEIYFGDWNQFLIGETMALEIKASEEATYWDGSQLVSAYANDQTVMRAIQREDFGLRYGNAFVVKTGVWTK